MSLLTHVFVTPLRWQSRQFLSTGDIMKHDDNLLPAHSKTTVPIFFAFGSYLNRMEIGSPSIQTTIITNFFGGKENNPTCRAHKARNRWKLVPVSLCSMGQMIHKQVRNSPWKDERSPFRTLCHLLPSRAEMLSSVRLIEEKEEYGGMRAKYWPADAKKVDGFVTVLLSGGCVPRRRRCLRIKKRKKRFVLKG